METKRVFIAFPVSKEVRWEVERTQAELKKENRRAQVKWVEPEKIHVTVQFLGELIEERVELVKEVLSRVVANYRPFKYWLDQLDAFPNKTNPNIVIVKVGEEAHDSYRLQEEIVQELKKVGINGDEKPWKPHLTIGRNKRHEKIVGFDTVEVDKVVWEVDRAEFIESKLTSDGPVYNLLEKHFLK